MRWLDDIIDSMDMNLISLREIVAGKTMCCFPWGHDEWDRGEQLNNNIIHGYTSLYWIKEICFPVISE